MMFFAIVPVVILLRFGVDPSSTFWAISAIALHTFLMEIRLRNASEAARKQARFAEVLAKATNTAVIGAKPEPTEPV